MHGIYVESEIFKILKPTHVIFEQAERFFIREFKAREEGFLSVISEKIKDRGLQHVGSIVKKHNYLKDGLSFRKGLGELINKTQNYLFENACIDGCSDVKLDILNPVSEFYSLGQTCEFGYVQKFFDLGKMNLLNWADIDIISTIHLLNSDPSDLLNIENCKLIDRIVDVNKFAYSIIDSKYKLTIPDYVRYNSQLDSGGQCVLLNNLISQNKFLTKLFEDITTKGSKFVFIAFNLDDLNYSSAAQLMSSSLLKLNNDNKLLFLVPDSSIVKRKFIAINRSLLICKTPNLWLNQGGPKDISYYEWYDISVEAKIFFENYI